MKDDNLFSPIKLKGLELKNRIMMSPMCQYSVNKKDGIPTDWHYQHYISRAVGGTGLVMVEMTNVEPDGRITDFCLGLWNDEQKEKFKKIVEGIHTNGAKAAIQIGHAGRKAENAETPVGPSAIPFDETFKTPRALENEEVYNMIEKYRYSVRAAVESGFDTIEIHGAHGYLIHEFHSARSNQRKDEFGQKLTLFGEKIIEAAREEMPEEMPLIVRISGTEFVADGYGIDGGIEIAKAYYEAGADIIDVSAGGEGPIPPFGKPGTHAGYQVPYARKIKEALNIPVIAVGRLDDFVLSNAVIGNDEADLVAVGRGLLRNPYWALEANQQLRKVDKNEIVPHQYLAGFR
ncbi:NADH:flavin oxidoreductase/NADH oxidase [Staphylococcus sp. GSSP0090]|nr:NADH:flavin oxidoreductase/NADH oxidase [Staphylococcus sp. GSSP0090]